MKKINKKAAATAETKDIPKGFPAGLKLTEATKSTETHHIAWGSIQYGRKTVRVNLIRSIKAPEGAEFLPASVFVDQKKVWSFPEEKKEGFKGFAFIRNVASEVIILLLDHNERIVKVVPLYDLASQIIIKSGDKSMVLGVRSAEKLYDLKMAAHKELRLRYELTDKEKKIRAERIVAEKAEIEKNKLKAEAQRREKLGEILKRPEVYVYIENAKRLRGLPVTSAEWEILPNDTRVVIVKEYDGKLKKPAGDPIEFFIVTKGDGSRRPKKSAKYSKLSWEKPITEEDEKYGVLGIIEVDLADGEGVQTIGHVNDDGLRKLQNQDVNGGTPVAVGEPDTEGKIKVVRLEVDKVEEVGYFLPIQ